MENLAERFKEPSSWAGIAVLINLASPLLGLPPGAADVFINAGAALAALSAFFLKEKSA